MGGERVWGESDKPRGAGHGGGCAGVPAGAAAGRDGPYRSILDGDAGDVGALQGPAYRFGLIAIEAGEASPEQLFVAFGDDRFGERICLGEQSFGLTARRVDSLLRFTFAVEGADLNDPASMHRGGLDRTVLLNGLWQRLGRGSWIDIGHDLRGGALRGGPLRGGALRRRGLRC